MARRMFSSRIVNSDPFLDMPVSVQALYFHLGMHADDEGFVYPKQVMRSIGANDDDLKILFAKKFVLPFESGVIVIKHWHVNNSIRHDRVLSSTHLKEKSLLSIDNSGVYSAIGNQDAALRLPNKVSNQVIKKERVSKDTRNANADSELSQEEIAERIKGIRTALPRAKKI